jgi:hypothetical protein
MVVGLFVGMAIIVVILFSVTYVELVRIWRDMDELRGDVRQMSRDLDGLMRGDDSGR